MRVNSSLVSLIWNKNDTKKIIPTYLLVLQDHLKNLVSCHYPKIGTLINWDINYSRTVNFFNVDFPVYITYSSIFY